MHARSDCGKKASRVRQMRRRKRSRTCLLTAAKWALINLYMSDMCCNAVAIAVAAVNGRSNAVGAAQAQAVDGRRPSRTEAVGHQITPDDHQSINHIDVATGVSKMHSNAAARAHDEWVGIFTTLWDISSSA